MKLVTYTQQAGAEETVGVLGKTGDFVFPAGAAGCRYDTMTDLITHATDQELSMLGECAALDAATLSRILVNGKPAFQAGSGYFASRGLIISFH